MCNLWAALLATFLIRSCNTYKILLVFPVPGKGNFILGNGYVNNLLKAGHEVTFITPHPIKNGTTNLHQIDVSSNNQIFPGDATNLKKLLSKEFYFQDTSTTFSLMLKIANATVFHENVQRLIHDPKQQFDVVIVEWMYLDIYSGFASVFNCPYIWSSSMEPHPLALSLIDEMPNPAYSPGHLSINTSPPYTFWQRAGELWNTLHIKFHKWLISGYESKLFTQAFATAVAGRGSTLAPLDVVKYNASLMLGNLEVSSGQYARLPQNYVPLAGYHVEDVLEPLTKKLKRVMDGAKNGVVYFSMGSILRSESLPDAIKKGLLDVFGRLNYTVIWKFEGNMSVPYNNVHLVNWAPQQSILAHPNCVLFVTNGGLLSITEAINYGVPIIGIPIYADQFHNIDKAVQKGFASRIELNYDTPRMLKVAIEDGQLNAKHRDRIKELSRIYHDRLVCPRKQLVHWVEHVIRTRGAPHLRSPALLVPWYQKTYLDLLLLFILGSIFIIGLICYLVSKRKKDEDLMKKWI